MLICVLKLLGLNPFCLLTAVRTIDALLEEQINPTVILFVTLVNVLEYFGLSRFWVFSPLSKVNFYLWRFCWLVWKKDIITLIQKIPLGKRKVQF